MAREIYSKAEKTIAGVITATAIGWVLYNRYKYVKTAKKEQEVLLDTQIVPDIDGIGRVYAGGSPYQKLRSNVYRGK